MYGGQRFSRQLLALLLVALVTCGGSPIVNAQATVEGSGAEGVDTGAGDQPAPTPIENEFEFEYGHGRGDAKVGPLDQGLVDQYLILWRDWADWLRPTPRYPDVPPGHPFYSFIERLSNRRAVSGDVDASNNFNPYASLTRARAVKASARQHLLSIRRDRLQPRPHLRLCRRNLPTRQ